MHIPLRRLLAAALAAVLGLAAVTAGFLATRPGPEARAERLLARELARDPDAVARELRAYNPEWDFMHRTFLALSLADRALAHPDEADLQLQRIDAIVRQQMADQAAHGDAWFLLDYVHARPFRDPTGRSVFVDGEIALVLGARRFVRDDDPALAAEHRARVEALAAQFARSPALLPESYPDEAWLFCNTNALVAIRMADLLDGTDHQPLIDAWLANARERLIEPDSGLLGSEYSWSGAPQDGPEGSSVWLVAVNLRLLDPALAEQQYTAAREALVRDVAGLGYAREWGPGWHGPVDVDSGPLVPILQASPSSSGFALMAAHAFGDAPTYRRLTRALGAADVVTALDPRLAALAANPMGDVIVLHGLPYGPREAVAARADAT
ncbi:MAG: hypothetical protein R3F59_33900 [Myxococcota bacterium]